ncbi:NF-kappa-B inhibitor zeta [Boleophthalmus pectinirostris]|uniref:NF-kappa-B inhibitor zeta n=1 Tax=Boleophthalmus pectinirostris TaxID=150288 RepID=UPI00242DC44B|nr:NF-kappa-B inhibitor zeta [Boleophthalmus pectinirostris]
MPPLPPPHPPRPLYPPPLYPLRPSTPSTPPMVQSEQTCMVQSMVPPEQTCPVGPSVGVPLGSSLFHWQIQAQLKKIKGVPTEVLSMRDVDGDTPLHIAVAQGKRPLAYVLASIMSASGTLNTPERNGQTALHIATATDQPLIVSDLLEHGAQVHMRDTWGRSPVHVCVEKGHAESLVAMFKTLRALGKHLDLDMVNYNGLTSLHVAVLSHNALLRQVRAMGLAMGQGIGSCKERDRLLKMGMNLYKCVKALLQNGASVGAKDEKSGRTSIHMAAEEANTDLLHLLLNQPCTPAVVNLRTYSGNMALHIVCALEGSKAQLDAVKMLMRRGADPGARNLENEVPGQLLPEGGATNKVRQVLRGRYFQM